MPLEQALPASSAKSSGARARRPARTNPLPPRLTARARLMPPPGLALPPLAAPSLLPLPAGSVWPPAPSPARTTDTPICDAPHPNHFPLGHPRSARVRQRAFLLTLASVTAGDVCAFFGAIGPWPLPTPRPWRTPSTRPRTRRSRRRSKPSRSRRAHIPGGNPNTMVRCIREQPLARRNVGQELHHFRRRRTQPVRQAGPRKAGECAEPRAGSAHNLAVRPGLPPAVKKGTGKALAHRMRGDVPA